MRHPVFVTAALVVPLVLAGCSSGARHQDLDEYMKEVRERPAPPVKPLPEFKSYEPFAYSAANQRSPFEQPVEVKRVGPTGDPDLEPYEDRPKEYLEQFAIGQLEMVGTLKRNGNTWALIRDPEGSVHRVASGDYMGTNHGQIQSIREGRIELSEIVSDGAGGWLRRSRTVSLSSQQQG